MLKTLLLAVSLSVSLMGFIRDEAKAQLFIDNTGSDGGNATTNTTNTTNTSTLNPTGTASDLTDLVNSNQTVYPNSFNNSFNGNNFSNQCGLSFSTGYSNNSFQGSWYITATLNTNPCVDQEELEKKREEAETDREQIRSFSSIINTCIVGRTQAILNDKDPNSICKLDQFDVLINKKTIYSNPKSFVNH